MKPPFDSLPAVTELIRLYKSGVLQRDLAYFFGTTQENIKLVLFVHNIPPYPRGRKRHASRPAGFWTTPEPVSAPTVVKEDYTHLINEPINRGHSYQDILRKQKVKFTKLY